ncbi:MAG: LysR family transcriptional regulator [Caulobacteraceae bacterium]|nr:LysR family transcriptional regulator [Caulobacteraceae bacterium]
MPEMRRLRHFAAVAEAGSFVRAAEILGLSQPALSRSIQSLETEYELRLFHRRRHGLALTPAGEILHASSQRLLTQIDDMDQQMRRLGRAEEGRVALGLGPLPASIYLPALLTRTIATRRGIEVKAVVETGSAIVKRVMSGELDFCCCSESLVPQPDRVESIPLVSLPIVRIVRASHPLCRGQGAPSDFPLIGGSGAADGGSGAYHPQVTCDDYDILKRLTLASDAIWLTAAQAAADELAAGQLVQLPRSSGDRSLVARLVVFRQPKRSLSSASAYVLGLLRKIVAGS